MASARLPRRKGYEARVRCVDQDKVEPVSAQRSSLHSTLKSWVRLVVPPAVGAAASVSKMRGGIRGRTFNSFSDALEFSGAGYLNSEIVDIVVDKTVTFRDSLEPTFQLSVNSPTARTLLGIAVATRGVGAADPLRVLDFGGGCGAAYFTAKSFFGESFKSRWCVVETKEMVQRAKPIFSTQELTFLDTMTDAALKNTPCDLIYSSAALQYTPDPISALHRLVELTPSYLFLTGLAVTENSTPVTTLQLSRLGENGPGPLPRGYRNRYVNYPITYVPRSSIEGALQGNFSILCTFDEGRAGGRIDGYRTQRIGYLCRAKYGADT